MVVIVMGVVGVGKSTVGRLLAEQLGWSFVDADHYHSVGNIEKMRSGTPLTDEDRRPWLLHLRAIISGWITQGRNGVLACSALKHRYQDELRIGPEVRFILLNGDANLIAQRLQMRQGHFAGTAILASQLADLEAPEESLSIEISQSPEKIVGQIRARLGLAQNRADGI